ncbi:MAG TPA: SIR2 family protein [Magnetospirillaceae bacterium]|jgi:tetratricopeptide (TPR) repeat protein
MERLSLLELVEQWPYAREFVLDTMDQELIQHHGELMLSRSLNIGRMVAFVGAGVSMSYGRISWRDLVREALQAAESAYGAAQKEYEDAEHANGVKRAFGARYPRIRKVRETLGKLKPEGSDADAWLNLRPARLLVLFQIAHELGEALRRIKIDSGVKDETNQVRGKVHRLAYDDAGHALLLLEAAGAKGLLERFSGPIEKRALTRKLENTYPIYQEIFSTAIFHKAIESAKSQQNSHRLSDTLIKLLSTFGDYAEATGTRYLNPTHRFAVAATLAALDKNSTESLLRDIDAGLQKRAQVRMRSETVGADRDPLLMLHASLGIRRFITTNYDLDIEQMMLDLGLRLRTDGKRFVAESVNAIEARARDFVFARDRAAHLIDFAVQDARLAIDLVHLHGRATEGDKIVATEADYQDLYLRDDGKRDLLDGAINLAFRGNALLFVGNGMGEDDLLRPLRHFMSETQRVRDSSAIALLPDLKGDQDRAEEKVSLLRRYGVYAVHFGRGRLTSEPGIEDYILPDLVKIVRFVRKVVLKIGTEGDIPESYSFFAELKGPDAPKPSWEKCGQYDGGGNAIGLKEIADIEMQSPIHINCELKTVNYLIDFCLQASKSNPPSTSERAAAIILANNLEDALVAGFLSATIARLRAQWDVWRSSWFGDVLPRAPQRLSELQVIEQSDAVAFCPQIEASRIARLIHPELHLTIDRRRMLALPDYDDNIDHKEQQLGRHFHVRMSQTLAQTCAALAIHFRDRFQSKRRVFVLAGPRGTGKGQFFAALTEKRGLIKFFNAISGQEVGLEPDDSAYIGAFAFNFSFSVEIGSGFDRVIRFLIDRFRASYKHDPESLQRFDRFYKQVASESPTASGDRIGALAFLMKVASGQAIEPNESLKKPRGRIAIFFNATHLLFNPLGHAKSADVARVMNILLNPVYADAKIDLIFITDDKGLPIEFRDRLSRTPHVSRGTPLNIESPYHRWSMEVVKTLLDPTRTQVEDAAAMQRISLRIDSEDRRRFDPDRNCVGFFFRLRPSILGVVVAAAFPKVFAAVVLKTRYDNATATERTQQPWDKFKLEFDPEKQAAEALGVADSDGRIDKRKFVDRVHSSEWPEAGTLGKAGSGDSSLVDSAFRKYYKAFGGSRFALTIVFAAADEDLDVRKQPSDAVGTLDMIYAEAGGIEDPSRQDAIVRAVLAQHRRRGIRKEYFNKIFLRRFDPSGLLMPTDEEWPRCLRILSELCDEMLVVLSMVGHPIEADCVVALHFKALDEWPGAPLESDEVKERILLCVLEILVWRCLVFRFIPQKSFDESGRVVSNGGRGGESRFGVHRHIQRHVFRHLEQPLVEHAEIESYMPTLYAHQPNDLPYPTAAAQDRIREIVAVLSRYPSRRRLGERDVSSAVASDAERQIRMLRAAYGVIRTVYGVGVVARFHEYDSEEIRPREGYFEEHRRQVRWLLKRAKDLGADVVKKPNADDSRPPFYSGEIAWLYNECGVLSLAQGALDDAGALFAQAIRSLNPIERRGAPAALTTHIRLNRALVDIERGKLRKAHVALRDIIAQEDEHRAIRWIAFGYTGLIEHLRGDLDEGQKCYSKSIEVLTSMKRYRAASIFARHNADLHRRLGKDALQEARRLADEAVNLAAAGSHSDILHQARLSRLQIVATEQGSGSFARLRKEMEDIEAYAKTMGMPRLEVETSYVDAWFRRQLGDLTLAMKRISHSLAIANECDLVLRKIGSMLLAARISRDLDMRDGARALAITAKEMAIAAEYSIAQDSAQTLLASL